MAGVPILASRMDANVGQLGADYPRYFPVGNTMALANPMRRASNDFDFVSSLERAVTGRAPLFALSLEIDAWRGLLTDLKAKDLNR